MHFLLPGYKVMQVFVHCCIVTLEYVFRVSKSGVCLRSGMKKNEKLEANIITPTTKAADHDLPISGPEVREIYLIFLGFSLT